MCWYSFSKNEQLFLRTIYKEFQIYHYIELSIFEND